MFACYILGFAYLYINDGQLSCFYLLTTMNSAYSFLYTAACYSIVGYLSLIAPLRRHCLHSTVFCCLKQHCNK